MVNVMAKEAYIVASKAEGQAVLDNLNLKLGYPRAGVNQGKGKHVPPEQSVTKQYTYLLAHKDGIQFAVPADKGVDANIEGPAQKTVLDDSWTDAKHVDVSVAVAATEEIITK